MITQAKPKKEVVYTMACVLGHKKEGSLLCQGDKKENGLPK